MENVAKKKYYTYVYVLKQGENYKGTHIGGLYKNEDSALRVLAERFNFCFDQWKDETDERYVSFMPEWYASGEGFTSGCDFWTVYEQAIED